MPKSLCSWDYQLAGDGHRGAVALDLLRERGEISADGIALAVRTDRAASGRWALERAGEEVAAARQLTFLGDFEIADAAGTSRLHALSGFGRRFQLERAEQTLATIARAHPFTRRATIEAPAGACDFATLCFCFWLAVLTWRRDATDRP